MTPCSGRTSPLVLSQALNHSPAAHDVVLPEPRQRTEPSMRRALQARLRACVRASGRAGGRCFGKEAGACARARRMTDCSVAAAAVHRTRRRPSNGDIKRLALFQRAFDHGMKLAFQRRPSNIVAYTVTHGKKDINSPCGSVSTYTYSVTAVRQCRGNLGENLFFNGTKIAE